MANVLRILGNFVTVRDSGTGEEYIRNVLAETTYTRDASDNFTFLYKQAQVSQTTEIYKLGDTYNSFAFADFIDYQTGLAFPSADDLDEFLAENLACGCVKVASLPPQPPAPPSWTPQGIFLGSWVYDGIVPFIALGAGHLFTFDANQNDQTHGNVDLDTEGVAYDGQSIEMHIHWQIFSAPGGGDNVIWELDYAFCKDGDDNYAKVDGTVQIDVDVSSRIHREQYTDILPAISGAAGATSLQMTIRRLGQGGGSDSYGGDADIYTIGLIES
jgi:hypothetical protein